MTHWWELDETGAALRPIQPQAVAYYRHSAQDRQENSIPLQQEQVREWADKHGVEIMHEFADHGKSGLNAEGRPAFSEMMHEWVEQRNDFEYVLCLDVSRWGRFQDIDLSAQYSAICKKNGKQVVYTTIGKQRDDDSMYPVYVQFERFRAAQYSKELSQKVWRGSSMIAGQGYSPGGSAPYGLTRMLLDEAREPVGVLEPGQHKSIQNQRVTLCEGPPFEVAVIRRIFHEFVDLKYSEFRIAEGLNDDGIPSPGGGRWGAAQVRSRLQIEKYAGTMVYNKTSQKLKSPQRNNALEEWVRTPGAFDGLVSSEQFQQAQEILEQRRQKYQPERMLEQLDALYRAHGLHRSSLLKLVDNSPSAAAYARRFGSLDFAFQQLFRDERDQARQRVQEQICQRIPEVLPYADFFVLDQRVSLSIEPMVPVPNGYGMYWPFRRDRRQVIDITLGVPLSEPGTCDILGYVPLPRWLTGSKTFRFSARSSRAELFGCSDLGFLEQLLGTKGQNHG
jgi:DNA invertase Pin-like site-specific DNA recombinase